MFAEPDFTEEISKCSELKLYLYIEYLGGFIWRMNHDLCHGRIDDSDGSGRRDIAAAQKQIERAVAQTIRFGVAEPFVFKASPLDDEAKKVASDDYWRWYRWWDGWQKSLTDEQYKRMDNDVSSGHAESWRPTGDWRELAASRV